VHLLVEELRDVDDLLAQVGDAAAAKLVDGAGPAAPLASQTDTTASRLRK